MIMSDDYPIDDVIALAGDIRAALDGKEALTAVSAVSMVLAELLTVIGDPHDGIAALNNYLRWELLDKEAMQ